MESILDFINTEEGSERLWLLSLGLFRDLVAEEFLPTDDWALQFDVFLTILFSRDRFLIVNEQKDN